MTGVTALRCPDCLLWGLGGSRALLGFLESDLEAGNATDEEFEVGC